MSNIVSAKTVLVLGDSLSAAYNMPVQKGWVHLLRQDLQERFNNQTKVVNISISGETSARGMARLPQALDTHQPDIVIIELGANDGLQGMSLKQMKRNLTAMIEMSARSDAAVILAGMQLPPNYGAFFNDRFKNVFIDLAKEHDITLIPFLLDGVGGVSELMQPDDLHPNAQAQPVILRNVLKYLEPKL